DLDGPSVEADVVDESLFVVFARGQERVRACSIEGQLRETSFVGTHAREEEAGLGSECLNPSRDRGSVALANVDVDRGDLVQRDDDRSVTIGGQEFCGLTVPVESGTNRRLLPLFEGRREIEAAVLVR